MNFYGSVSEIAEIYMFVSIYPSVQGQLNANDTSCKLNLAQMCLQIKCISYNKLAHSPAICSSVSWSAYKICQCNYCKQQEQLSWEWKPLRRGRDWSCGGGGSSQWKHIVVLAESFMDKQMNASQLLLLRDIALFITVVTTPLTDLSWKKNSDSFCL